MSKTEKDHKLNSRRAAGIAVNVLSAALFALAAFLFIAYALNFKSLKFIAEHFILLLWISGVSIALLFAAYILFYVLGKQSLYRLIYCLLICLDIFAVIFFVISKTGVIEKITDIDELRSYISGFGVSAAMIFILFQFLQVVILPVPGSVSVAVGVALFGPLYCALYSLIGILLGSFAGFAIGRVIGYKAVAWVVGKDELDKWLKKMKGKDYLLLSIMFLLPLFPDDILCFVAGLSSMTWLYFSVMIVVTRVISVFTTSYSLDLIPFTTWWGILIWILLAALVVISFWLVCKYSDKIDSFIKRNCKLKRKK